LIDRIRATSYARRHHDVMRLFGLKLKMWSLSSCSESDVTNQSSIDNNLSKHHNG